MLCYVYNRKSLQTSYVGIVLRAMLGCYEDFNYNKLMKKVNQINPYIYPSPPFEDLTQRKFQAVFTAKKKYTTDDLKKLLATQKHIGEYSDNKELSVEDRILNLFFNPDLLLGDKKIIEDERDEWIKSLKYFTKAKKPISFTIVGYAYKIPVPLKTNRTLADMGEVLSLFRLKNIADLIKEIYAPGAHMYVFTDGIFGRYNNVTPEIYRNYKFSLDHIVEEMGWDDVISVHELDDMEQTVDNFPKRFDNKLATLKKLYEDGDKTMVAKYDGTLASIKKLININTFKLTKSEQMDVYDESKKDDQVSAKVKKARDYINTFSYDMTFIYHGYLSYRDDIHYLENFAPGHIRLSVSPKKSRIGIQPVSKYASRFPYHGIPVFHKKSNHFTIEYLVDMNRWNKKITPASWTADSDKKPFFYIIND